MRIRITQAGLYGVDGPILIGTELALKGEPPAGWRGKYEVIKNDPKPEAVAVTNKPKRRKKAGS